MRSFEDNSKEFDINNEKIQIIANNPYYVLPKNTKIYFGSKHKVFNDQPTFFGFDYNTAKKYGFVKTFKTKRELHLLALMELTTEHSFYKIADEKWKKQMQEIFSVGNKIKERFSDGISDRNMMNYLCSKSDMDGYAMHGSYIADQFHGNNFDAELVLCKPIKDADLIDEADHNKNSTTPPRLKRKTRTLQEEEEEEENSPYFHSSSYGGPPITPVKPYSDPLSESFVTPGGKKRKTKRRQKIRKSKKSKRKQRKTRKR